MRKVYGIVGLQLVLTAVVGYFVASSPALLSYVAGSLALQLLFFLGSFLLLFPLYLYQDRHPENMIFLGLWTALMSVSLGMACSLYAPLVVLEAVALTAGVVTFLVLYAHYAVRKGLDFSPYLPLLGGLLWTFVLWGFVQLFFHPGPAARTVYALLGALLFSAYLVVDAQMVATRFELDNYIWASVTIYLDIINLFLRILQLLGDRQN